MEFKKYNSIKNSYQKDFLQAVHAAGLEQETYVVQEKVHGANVSFITDGTSITLAKRTGLIPEGESFYNVQSIEHKYAEKVKKLCKVLQETSFRSTPSESTDGTENADTVATSKAAEPAEGAEAIDPAGGVDVAEGAESIQSVTIFGELFGGGYPHKDIPVDKGATLVQRGIYYNPHNDFYAFDILINQKTYLSVEQANKLFKQCGFIYAHTLFSGTLEECLQYSNAFPSTIPALYGLPAIEGNICEGVVIRTATPQFLPGGDRVILKNKNEQWSENNRYVDREALRALFQDDGELSEAAYALMEEVTRFVSKNRLANVLSKIGEVTPSTNLDMVAGRFTKDIIADFAEEYGDKYHSLEKFEKKEIGNFARRQAKALVIEQFS